MSEKGDNSSVEWKKFKKRINKFMDSSEVQIFLTILLLLSLFLVDSYVLGNASDGQDNALYGVLVTIIFIFSLETIILSIVSKDYFNGFFFWMDILGTLSILLDVGWLFGADVHNASNASVLRATRAAKLGARYGRILRMIRIIKSSVLCPCLNNNVDEDKEPTLSAVKRIANKLINQSSRQVALLTVVIVIVVPFLGYQYFDYSPQAWIDSIQVAANDPNMCSVANLQAMADRFKSFYNHKDEKIRYILIESPYFGCGGTLNPDQSPHGGAVFFPAVDTHYPAAGGRRVTKSQNIFEYESVYVVQGTSYTLKAEVDMTIPNQWDAFFGIMLMLLVIIVLFGFTASFHSVFNELVVEPLQKLMSTLRRSATMMIGSLKSLEKEKKEEERRRAEESGERVPQSVTTDDTGDDDDDAEAAALELLVEKLSKIVKAVVHTSDRIENNEHIDKATADFINAQYSTKQTSHEDALPTNALVLEISTEGDAAREQAHLALREAVSKIIDPNVLNTWNFDVLAVNTHEELFTIVHYMFDSFFGFLEEFRIPPVIFHNFMVSLAERYINTNSYHHFRHAVDVCHTTYRLLTLSEVGATASASRRVVNGVYGGACSSLEMLSILVAALGHDVGHPAVNNGFLVKTKHVLAYQHNDKSPLENMHSVTLYEIITGGTYSSTDTPNSSIYSRNGLKNCDIFAGLTETQWRESRRIIISVILGTDMINHFEQVKKCQLFQELQKDNIMNYYTGETSTMECLTKDGGNRLFILDLIVHCSDINNPIKPFQCCVKWANLVVKEFFDQGDKEKALGLEVSPGFDRVTTNLCNMQMGFIEFVVAPLLNAMVNIFPPLHSIGENMADNFQSWGNLRIEEISNDSKMTDDAKSTETSKLRERLDKFRDKMSFVDTVKAEIEVARIKKKERRSSMKSNGSGNTLMGTLEIG